MLYLPNNMHTIMYTYILESSGRAFHTPPRFSEAHVSRGRHVCLLSKKTCLLVQQGDMPLHPTEQENCIPDGQDASLPDQQEYIVFW